MTDKAAVEQKLTSANIKITEARFQVLMLLHINQGHYSAEEIHSKLINANHNIGLATIYRTLVQLEAVGLILRHSFIDGVAIYELNDGDHGHAVCMGCGIILEFNDHIIKERQQIIATELGLNSIRASYTIYGRCKKCQNPL
jgi:Fur family ferric uptake transcriptional regulator